MEQKTSRSREAGWSLRNIWQRKYLRQANDRHDWGGKQPNDTLLYRSLIRLSQTVRLKKDLERQRGKHPNGEVDQKADAKSDAIRGDHFGLSQVHCYSASKV